MRKSEKKTLEGGMRKPFNKRKRKRKLLEKERRERKE